MTDIKTLQEDLGYVASAVRRSGTKSAPAIFLLWAVLVLPGFALGDIDPHLCGIYWLIFAPLGALASWWLDRIAVRQHGERDREQRRRSWMSGLAVGVAFTMFGHIVSSAHVPTVGVAQLWLLLQGLCFTLLGVHRTKELIPAGMLMFIGCAALFFVPASQVWTAIGLIASGALLTGWLFTRTTTKEIAP